MEGVAVGAQLNLTVTYPIHCCGVFGIDNAVRFMVLSVTLRAPGIASFHSHVGILMDGKSAELPSGTSPSL